MRIVVILYTGQFKVTVERDGNETMNIPVDGSGRVSVMDISNDTESDDSGLLCQYRTRQISYRRIRPRWQLNGIEIPRQWGYNGIDHHGWSSKVLSSAPNMKMLLQRTRNGTAREGFFSCYYDDKTSTVGVFYPSE